MAYGSVELIPGVNVERTPTLLRAGVSQSSLIRYRDGLVQKLGGWQRFYPFAVSGIPRDLHAWQDLNNNQHLSVATTLQLGVITPQSVGNPLFQDITPQTFISNTNPTITTTLNSPTVNITDPNVTNVTPFDSVFFNVPVSIGGLILDGLYQIASVTGTDSYTITAPTNATSGTSTFSIPIFTATMNSSAVSVGFTNHGVAIDNTVFFPIPTTVGGLVILGGYEVIGVTDANNFVITAANTATSNDVEPMNGGLVQFVYYIALGPSQAGVGYGLGQYGEGAYGFGTSAGSPQTGTKITATDWTADNWGSILLACPADGGIYFWDPSGGFGNASIVSTAPPFNSGIFVSTSQQILLAYGSSVHQAIGYQQEPMLVQWSDVSNFFQWDPTAADQAGNFVIPIGSAIMAGMAVSNQNLFWTDLDLWAASYIGPPDVFGFNKIGAGVGAVSRHSVQQFRGSVFWMGQTNFFSLTGGGASAIPCPVWDAVFQNINTSFLQNVRAMPNTPFNEIGWLYPSAASTSGECDSYVKLNVTDPSAPWDYGPMQRSAWIDQTILGPPIGASPQGLIFQHETSPDADGGALIAQFTTGFFYLGEGEDFVTVDQIIPDFKWSTFPGGSSATIQITFNIVNYPGDTPTQYGPFPVTQATEFIFVRMRGRLMSIDFESADLGSFWRIGSVKYRYKASGRR